VEADCQAVDKDHVHKREGGETASTPATLNHRAILVKRFIYCSQKDNFKRIEPLAV